MLSHYQRGKVLRHRRMYFLVTFALLLATLAVPALALYYGPEQYQVWERRLTYLMVSGMIITVILGIRLFTEAINADGYCREYIAEQWEEKGHHNLRRLRVVIGCLNLLPTATWLYCRV